MLNQKLSRPSMLRVSTALSALLVVAGCSIKPEPLQKEDVVADVQTTRSIIYKDQEPVGHRINLETALARALLYNLDRKVAMMEEVTQSEQLKVLKYEMLPRLAANAGYFHRNNDLITTNTTSSGTSENILESRTRFAADLTLSWNLLDFGTSYYQSKQQADKILIAHERKRRSVNNIFQEVTAAYWDAATAQRLQPLLNDALRDARAALADIKQAELRREMSPAEALRMQRDLLELVRQLEIVSEDMGLSKTRLARLMGMSPSTPFDVVVNADTRWLPSTKYSLEEMEVIALTNRPETQEERYNIRIAQHETRRALLKYMPNFNPFALGAYDSNQYLLYHNWAEIGLRAGFQLISLLQLPDAKALAEAQVELAKQKQLAVNMAVIAQVHVSVLNMKRARKNFDNTHKIAEVEQRLSALSAAKGDANLSTNIDRIRARSSALAAELQRDRAYAELMNAHAATLVTMGVDLMPDDTKNMDVATLTELIRTSKQKVQQNAGEIIRLSQAYTVAQASAAASAAAQAKPSAVQCMFAQSTKAMTYNSCGQ